MSSNAIATATAREPGSLVTRWRSRTRAGVHPKVVFERLGHATVSMTLDVYSHAIPALQEDAAAKIAALV
jgi:hypothetical protein